MESYETFDLEANDGLVVQVRPDSPLVTLQQIARNAALKAKQDGEFGRVGGGRGSGSNSRKNSHDNLLNSSGRNRSSSELTDDNDGGFRCRTRK